MLIQGIVAIVIFAFVPLAIKATVASPLTICLTRLLFTVSFLALFWKNKIQFSISEPNFKKLLALGIVFFVHWITYAYAVKLGGPSIGVLGLSTYGIQLVLASALFLGHHISKKDIWCLLLCVVGIAFIVPSWNFKDQSTLGTALSLLSATSFALIPILHKNSQEYSKETRIFFQFFGAMICFLFFLPEVSWNHFSNNDWLLMAFLALFGTLLAHSLWANITSKISAMAAGMSYYTIAPITLLLSWFLLGERLTLLQLFGAFIVVLSAMWSSYSGRKT